MMETRSARNRPVGPAQRVWGRNPLAQVIALALAAVGSPLWAGPAGERVIAGGATISRPDTGSTVIHQTSDKAAINWQNFDVGAAESVRFDQPSSTSAALNRVLGQSPTEILGALAANGQVFVLNPNGVLFGASAQVNVGSLPRSTWARTISWPDACSSLAPEPAAK
jgi:filamentous hemagglutinin family protein